MKTLRIICLALWIAGIIAWFTMPWISVQVGSLEKGVTSFDLVCDPDLSEMLTEGDTLGQGAWLLVGPCYLTALMLLTGVLNSVGKKAKPSASHAATGAILLFIYFALVNFASDIISGFSFGLLTISCQGAVVFGCLCAVQFVLVLIMKRMEPQTDATPPVKRPVSSPAQRPISPTVPAQTPAVVTAQPTTAPASSEPQEVPVADTQADTFWVCDACHTKNLNTRIDCWSCGKKK